MQEVTDEAKAIYEQADAAGRDLTPKERGKVAELMATGYRAKDAELREKVFGKTGVTEMVRGDGTPASVSIGSPGERFTKSEGFQEIGGPAKRGQTWTSGAVEVSSGRLGSYSTKAGTLLESQGAGLVPVPQVVPGQVVKLFEELGVADLFATAPATTSSVRYVNEGTATSGAAGVAEAGAKPASDLTLSTVDEPIKKIATSLIVSDEILDDVTSVQMYLNSRLSLFVRIEEERQLLRGAGTNELVGLIGRSGVNTYARGTVDNNAVALARVIANTRGSSHLEPDGIVMHPTNWLSTRLLTDTAGQFLGGGPFTGAYGNPGSTAMFGATLWNKPVVLSSVVGAGTALVGSFGQGAQLFRRGGVTVEATNSHADLFLSDQVAIRAEERLGLALYRPAAFTVVSGLS